MRAAGLGIAAALFALAGCGRGPHREPEAPREPAPPVAPIAVSSSVDASSAGASSGAGCGPGGALVLDGTPEVPAELRERLGRYLEARSAAVSALADDGKSLLIETRFANTVQVHAVKQPLGDRTQLTFLPEPATRPSFVPGRSDAFVFVTDQGGNEKFQVHRQDLKTGAVERLTDGKSRNETYAWSFNGDRLAWNSNARNGKDMDIWLGDGKSAKSAKLLLEVKGQWIPLEFSRDGTRLLLEEYVSINDSRLYVLDIASKTLIRITPESPRASYRAAAFDPTGKRLYVTTDRDGEFVELFEADLAKLEAPWKPLSRHIKWNVESIELSSDGRTLAFVTNEDGISALHLLDNQTRQERAVAGIPKGVIYRLVAARNAPVLGFTLSNATAPTDSFTIDLRTQKVERWTESEVGGIPKSRFVEPELIRYPSFDGRKIPAFVYRAKRDGPSPVVVWIHGGPESQARPEFSATLQYLVVESGLTVIVPNVRGSDGYGKSYLLLDNAEKREDSVKDIGALLDWIGKTPGFDPKRVGVIGGSYGGYMVLASLFHYPDRIRAGVDVVGISNFVTFLEKTMAYRRDLRRAEYGDESDPKMREFLKKISPTTNAAKIRSALFVVHGANDPRVPAYEAEQIVQQVRSNGQKVWYMLAKNEGHGFQKKENRDRYTELAVMFLERELKAK